MAHLTDGPPVHHAHARSPVGSSEPFSQYAYGPGFVHFIGNDPFDPPNVDQPHTPNNSPFLIGVITADAPRGAYHIQVSGVGWNAAVPTDSVGSKLRARMSKQKLEV